MTTTLSFIFSGSRLYREPLDLNVKMPETFKPGQDLFQVKKGFTRLILGIPWPKIFRKFWVLVRTAGLFLLLIASDLDVGAAGELLKPLMPAILDQFSLPSAISFTRNDEQISFTNIQLSMQGAERQRKDAPGLVC